MIKTARLLAIAALLLGLGYLDLFATHATAEGDGPRARHAERPRVAGLGGAGSSHASAEGRYDLRSRRILTQVILLIKENYVDPSRVKPYDMLLAALDYIEKSVAEILVDEGGAPERVRVRVGTAEREFDLKITYAWEIGYKLRDVFEFIQDNISSDQDLKDIEYAAINGMLSTLDPHSVLLKPENFDEVKLATKGEFGGLGISIAVRDGALTIISPMDGTPAARAGLKALDKIVQIGEESTVNMGIEEAVQRLRGKPGTKVNITVLRPGWTEPRKFQMTRAIIKIESVTSELLVSDVGYIKVKSFQANTYDDVYGHLEKLKAKSKSRLKGLVLDLRNNPGGLLDQAILISDLFITNGPLVITVGEGNKKREEKPATLAGTEGELPLAVLINGGSASASEIVAGALKNHNRAVIIGQQSFGKGSVQVLYDFKDQSALKLTIAQYLTPGDVSIQSVGITPDVLLYPGAINNGVVHMFAHADYPREKDLDHHLDRQNEQKGNTDAPPSETMTYLIERQQRDDGVEEAPEVAADKFSEDFEIRLGREVVSKAVSTDRRRMLENASSLFKKQQAELDEKVAKALGGLSVDWSKGAADNAPETPVELRLNVYARPTAQAEAKGTDAKAKAEAEFTPTHIDGVPLDPARVRAGDDILLVATLRNNGNKELTRIYGITQSDNGVFDKREFVFGRLAPGETRTWALPVKIPKDNYARVDEVKLKIDGLTSNGATGRIVITVDELPRPNFAYTWQVRDFDKGNGDGLLDPGEEVDFAISLKNAGRGAALDTFVNLKNVSGENLFIEQGRAKLGAMQPGEEREAVMHFSWRNGGAVDKKKPAEMKLSVLDLALNEQLTEKVSFEPRDGDVPSKVESKRVNVRVTKDRTPIHTGADAATDVMALFGKGAVLKTQALVTRTGGSFYRVAVDGKKLGFVAASDVEPAAAGPVAANKKPDAQFSHNSPDILIADGIRGTRTTLSSIPLKGIATATRPMRDVYIFVNDQKVFYQSASKEPQRDSSFKHAFETNVPLKVGTNTVTVIARETEETAARQTFVLFRDGEVPVASKSTTNVRDKQ